MTLEETVLRVQLAFPKIYLACHTRHQNRRTTPHALSPRDSAILAHLSTRDPMQQSELARHLGVAKSTLSEALRWLVKCGFVERVASQDGREQPLLLTSKGAEAAGSSSVLERGRLLRAIAMLPERDWKTVVRGLELLARAATVRKGPACE